LPKFLEKILQTAAAAKGLTGRAADRYTFGTMNNIGAVRGNVETSKGRRMDAKHAAKMRTPSADQTSPLRPMHPKMVQRAAMVKEAHQHLAATVPEYHQATSRQKLMMGNHHVALRLGDVK
jgi:hypothetical protein